MLDQEEYNKRKDKLNEVIRILSTAQNVLQNQDTVNAIVKQLQSIYTYDCSNECEFRHEYSSILGVMIEIEQNEKLSLDVLGQNISMLYEICSGQDANFHKCLQKLYDHINLEIARMNYINIIESRLTDEKGNLKSSIIKLQKMVSKTSGDANDNKRKVDNLQRETITILGLFSAVVLVFMAGLSFSSSVLQSMYNSSIYKVAFISLVLGLILINVVNLLFRFITYINNHKERNTRLENMVTKLDVILLLLMIIVVLAWLVDFRQIANHIQKFIWNLK